MCIFCQNYDISHFNHGVETGPKKLAAMMLALQAEGCHNINFVTPTHVMPQIMEALVIAAENGLHLPLVYNTSGYEKADIIQKLDKIIDIYMPDFKFSCSDAAELYCNAPDYFENARSAIKEMHNQVGDLIISNRGIAERGLLVRHLVMPGDVAGSRPIMAFLAQHISKDTYINIMDQYRPCYRARQQEKINAPITGEEYSRVLTWAKEAGLHRFDKRNYFRIRLI
jgi:putative pyruvate formate lyase activating enzyme